MSLSFLKFYRRHSELMSKYNVDLKTLLQECVPVFEFYGDLTRTEQMSCV